MKISTSASTKEDHQQRGGGGEGGHDRATFFHINIETYNLKDTHNHQVRIYIATPGSEKIY